MQAEWPIVAGQLRIKLGSLGLWPKVCDSTRPGLCQYAVSFFTNVGAVFSNKLRFGVNNGSYVEARGQFGDHVGLVSGQVSINLGSL